MSRNSCEVGTGGISFHVVFIVSFEEAIPANVESQQELKCDCTPEIFEGNFSRGSENGIRSVLFPNEADYCRLFGV